MDRFIGREEELASLTRLFEGGAKLVCITGTAGIGKTRLAREWTGNVGVFVELTEARSEADIREEVRFALGDPPDEGFAEWLSGRGPQTIVLDQFEHLVEHAQATVAAWAAAAPQCKWVVTSRERLHLDGEQLLELGPLTLPEAETIEESSAAQLLLARAKQMMHSYRIEPGDEPVVAQIVRQLDGIPLALELAAPRLVLLGPQTLQQKLGERFVLLGGKTGTLRAALEWSWELLSPQEQEILARCAIFRGSFSVDSVDEILDWKLEPDLDLEDVLHSLVDKSLLRRALDGRFSLYLSLRDFARDKLEDELGGELRARHASHYAELGQRLVGQLQGAEAASAWRVLQQERDNVRAAADTAEDAEVAARAASVLGTVSFATGPLGSDEARITKAIEGDTELKDELYLQRGLLRLEAGSVDDAANDLREARRLAHIADHHRIESEALRAYARVLFYRGELAKAEYLMLYEALPIAEAFQETIEKARVHVTLGILRGTMGHVAEALSAFADAVETFETEGALREKSVTLGIHALWLAAAGKFDDALEALDAADTIQEEIATKNDSYQTAQVRGQVHLAAKDYSAAASSLTVSRLAYEHIGARLYGGMSTGYLGLAHLLGSGDIAAAKDLFMSALSATQTAGSVRDQIRFGAFAGGCAARLQEPDLARKLLQDAWSRVQSLGDEHLALAVALQRTFLWPGETTELINAAKTPSAGKPSPAAVSLDVLFSLRAHTDVKAPEGTVQRSAASDALFVDRKAGCFARPGTHELVDISKREILVRLFLALVDARADDPEGSLTREELIAIGWPGEKLKPKSAANRVHVAIATLRKLGLYDVIVSRKGTYAIHPAIPIREAER